MKKNLFIFGLLAGFGASAQNNDIQDIQDLIQNKQIKDKIKNEKPLVLPTVVSPSFYSTEDTPFILPNGDKVVYGSIDRMPIVQPNMKNFTIMPSGQLYNNVPRTMPNGSPKFHDLNVTGSNQVMDQFAPSPILDKILKNSGK